MHDAFEQAGLASAVKAGETSGKLGSAGFGVVGSAAEIAGGVAGTVAGAAGYLEHLAGNRKEKKQTERQSTEAVRGRDCCEGSQRG